ncbi:leucine-rich repeat-containing protein 63 [Mus caroli]|uniref:Leucine-rich repeat-containing protein 63 n=1 Tax=Mus caroli TaxID=10089 RepID=A0A6P5R2Q8_MUSCR|nr:leucine-rich repeat-containing protein 63 [Mus caroli]XP_021037644.1 leucine-rich repeat-containing protein 63 [Mus caroli]XP_021037645.1 leucine-rich repeat-containing protein 63 [Mus caroli]
MKKSIYHSLKTQQHPLLLRRPLPPKLPKVPLLKKKVRIVHTVKAREPKEETCGTFDPDESALVKVDKNVSQSQRPTSTQTISLDYDHKAVERVVNIFPQQHRVRRFHWKIPKSATGSMFIPRCLSASSRVFKNTLSQMKKRAKKSSKKEGKEDGYLTKKTFNTLVLSKEFPKPSPTSYSRFITSKFKPLGTQFHPAPKISGYIQDLPLLRDVKRTTLSPVSSVSTVIPEPQWSERTHPKTVPSKVILNTGSLPPARSLPTPVLPRKPPRQAMIENAAAAAAAAAATTTAAVSGKTEAHKPPETVQRTTRTVDPDAHVLRGEGFKAIGATRSETVLALTTLAIINCQIYGRNALNLKGFFLSNCPDLTPVAFQLIYLNLSFNDLNQFPIEILYLQNLQVLKLRNNPIKEIPSEIHLLTYLRIFSIAFNYITELPDGLFCLNYLEELDVSYNEIENISNEIQKLRSLEKLIVDGNPITSFPPGILKLNLIKFQIENTFTGSQFWLESSLNDPQQLTQICSLYLVKNKLLDYISDAVRKSLKSTSECDWCHGPKFGEGFRIIRSCDIFGVSHVPIMFHVCSSSCYRDIRETTFVLEGFPSRRIALHMDWVKESKVSNVSFYL